jgi:CMP-N-acetylneuraminic acid synthetase
MSHKSIHNINKQLQKYADSAISLRCKQPQDLEVVSSLLQDALIGNADLRFEKSKNSFLFVANRFCWETATKISEDKSYYRVLSGVNIQNVTSVKHQNLTHYNEENSALFYNLLTIEYDNDNNEVTLVFSQNVSVKLIVSELDIFLRDIAEPHPTTQIPNHFA